MNDMDMQRKTRHWDTLKILKIWVSISRGLVFGWHFTSRNGRRWNKSDALHLSAFQQKVHASTVCSPPESKIISNPANLVRFFWKDWKSITIPTVFWCCVDDTLFDWGLDRLDEESQRQRLGLQRRRKKTAEVQWSPVKTVVYSYCVSVQYFCVWSAS